MEISIYMDRKGKPEVFVKGSTKNTPKQVAKAYLEVMEELSKKGGKG